MKLNFKVRAKNPYFWIGLLGVIFSAMGVSTDTLTSWKAVADAFMDLIQNPYMIVSVIMSLIGAFNDPTTAGLSDSTNAMSYTSPKKSEPVKDEDKNDEEEI